MTERLTSVEATCAECGTRHVVVPPTLGQFRRPEDEPAEVELPDVPEGSHLVTANEQGEFTCANPGCRARIEVPELRLSA